MISFTLLFGYFGFLSPERRGYLINALIVSSIIFNTFSGYYSATFYRLFQGENWLINLIVTSVLFPCFLGVTLLITFIGFRFEGSSVRHNI